MNCWRATPKLAAASVVCGVICIAINTCFLLYILPHAVYVTCLKHEVTFLKSRCTKMRFSVCQAFETQCKITESGAVCQRAAVAYRRNISKRRFSGCPTYSHQETQRLRHSGR